MDLKDVYEIERTYGDGHDIKDSYHTMSELYFNRLVLFATIVNAYQEQSWKSKLHHDGTMFDNYFIVGIDTPEGQYTYHYDLKFWSYFNCKELDTAPEYDGHEPSDIGRLLSLK